MDIGHQTGPRVIFFKEITHPFSLISPWKAWKAYISSKGKKLSCGVCGSSLNQTPFQMSHLIQGEIELGVAKFISIQTTSYFQILHTWYWERKPDRNECLWREVVTGKNILTFFIHAWFFYFECYKIFQFNHFLFLLNQINHTLSRLVAFAGLFSRQHCGLIIHE